MAEVAGPEAWGAKPVATEAPADGPAAWGAAPVAVKDIGQGTALLEGALSGASAGFRDEIYGLSEASGLPKELGGFRAPIGAARVGYEKLTGQPGDATETYTKARDEKRDIQKSAKEQYPKTFLAGEVGGGLALPGGAMARGATMGGRMARGAAVGAGYGAASGAGAADSIWDVPVAAGAGAVVGAPIGAVAPPVVEGAVRAAGAIARPVVDTVRGAFRPADEASRRVLTAIERDVHADPNAATRLTPQEFAATPEASLIDLGADTTRALGRSAANTSPEGRGALTRTIDDRFEGQGPRITDWLRNTFNYPNAAAQQEAIETTARTVNNAAYRRAYRDGQNGLWSPELERLAGADAVTGAMQSAARKAKDEAIVSGYGAMNPRITFTPSGTIQFNRGPNGVPTYPDLQYWDLVRRELRDAAINAGRGTAEARRLNSFATSLNAELDRLVPSYQQARQGAAHFFQAENALEAGQNYVMQNFGNAEARRALARMTPTERQLFQDGFVSRYIETLDRTGDRRSILNKVAESPAAREKLNITLGPARATELEARLRIEGVMEMARHAISGNSTTARQLAELGLAGAGTGVGGLGMIQQDPTTITIGVLTAALAGGGRAINQNVARHVAEMLASHDPTVLARGLQIVTRNNRFLNNLRATDRRIAQVSGQQSGIPALQSPGAGHAHQDEQPVPRPPAQQ